MPGHLQGFSPKSIWEFASQNLTLSGTKRKEEEVEEEPRQVIGFLEGIDFLGAIVRKLKGEGKKKKKKHNKRQRSRKKEKRGTMHEHVTSKNKLHYGQKPNQNYNTHND